MKSEKIQNEPSVEALFRYQLVSQVLSGELRGEKRTHVISVVASQIHLMSNGQHRQVSPRTLYRWLYLFKSKGFSSLLPKGRQQIQGSLVLPDTLLNYFKKQKELDPKTSIPELIQRAREQGVLDQETSIDRTTVWRSLKRMGVNTQRGKTPKKDRDCRRFAYPHRMDMVLCDGKHFRAGAKRLKRVALFFLDDSTRMGLGVVVGTAESTALFLRGLYETLLKYGLMSAFYIDHGPGFIAQDTLEVMRKLNVLCIHGTVRYPEGHGKIEKFNQTALNHVLRTLDGNPEIDPDCTALELRLRHYVFERYNHSPHESLEQQTPWQRFKNDTRALRFKENLQQWQHAFLLHRYRTVSKDNVVSVDGVDYEVPRGYAGTKILLFHQILDRTFSIMHLGKLIRIDPVDLHANAQDKRAKLQDQAETRSPLPKSSAQISFERDLHPITDAEGGFTIPGVTL